MKIKEIYVEAKKSSNFQTYTVGFTADVSIDNDPDLHEQTKQLQDKCRALAKDEIAKDRTSK